MKKFLLKLIGWREQRSGADKFHQQEKIYRENARHHQQIAAENERDRLLRQRQNQVPSEQDILEPHIHDQDK